MSARGNGSGGCASLVAPSTWQRSESVGTVPAPFMLSTLIARGDPPPQPLSNNQTPTVGRILHSVLGPEDIWPAALLTLQVAPVMQET